MSRLSKPQLEERKNKKMRISAVLKMPGWKLIEEIIQDELTGNIEKLIKAEDTSARGAVSAIKRIGERISDEIEWGNAALEEYKTKYAKHSQAE